MPKQLYIFFLLLLGGSCWAQSVADAQLWADSAEYLIHEDMLLEQAAGLNKKAKAVFDKKAHERGQLHCQVNEIILLAQQDEFERGLTQALDVEKKFEGLNDSAALRGLYLQAKAWCHWGLAHYKEAFATAELAVQILRKHQMWARCADASILCSYAIYFDKNADFDAIDHYIEQTYQIAEQHLPPSRQIFRYIYQLYGAIMYQHGFTDRAISLTQEGLQYEYLLLAQKHLKRDSATIAKYYNNLGRMYAIKKDFEQAISYYINAYLLYKQLDTPTELVKVCSRIGDLYMMIGKREEADRYYGKILSYIPDLPASPREQLRLNSYNHLAVSNYFLHFGLHDSLVNYYEYHLPKIIEYDLAADKAYENLGYAYKGEGFYDKAVLYFNKALTYAKQKYSNKGTKVASYYYELGHLYLEHGQEERAIDLMDSVIVALQEEHIPEGDKLFFLEALLDKSIAAEAYKYRAKAYMRKGELQKAHADFNRVITLVNYLRDHYSGAESKMLSINQLRPVYENAAITAWRIYKEKGDEFYKERIFAFAENSKSSLLNEHIQKFRNNKRNTETGIPDSLLHQEEALIVRIGKYKEKIIESKQLQDEDAEAYYDKQLLRVEQKLDSLEKVLQRRYPSYRRWGHGRDSIVSPRIVQQLLDDKSVFVEYFISDFNCFVVYITAEEVKIKSIPDFNSIELKRKVHLLRRSISNIEYILNNKQEAWYTFVTESRWIYQHLLADDILEGKDHLIVVADNYLNYIPFEVLLMADVGQETKMNYQGLPYLIKDFAVHYEYSAAIMANNQDRRNVENGQILGFAATYGNDYNYADLLPAQRKERTRSEVGLHRDALAIPGTVDELQDLQQNFAGTYFYKEAANEKQLKQELKTNQFSVIHLAMHGVVDYKDAAYSCLLFTENQAAEEDNLLYSYEIQHLNGNNANLVVLSACQTGYGKYEQGEGIISLGRSFMYAGIPSVIMTLWELNDHTSVEVMQSFYHNLVAGESKETAMRHAKLTYLDRHPDFMAHPFFWASFVCIGNQQAIPLRTKFWVGYYWIIGGTLCLLLLLLIGYLRRRNSSSNP